MKVGSINIAGLSDFKIFLLLEVYNFDILCLQETWLTGNLAQEFSYPGYTLLE